MNSDYNNLNYEIDPNFAEKLMSTFYAGGDMSETDYKKCQKIWAEHNNNRSEVLKIVVELCGNVDTPQARYIRAIAWSFNSVMYSSERINAINDYLGKELYFKAYKNNSQTIDKGLKYGTKVHIARMLRYMADAYSHLKMYEKEEEIYLKIYDLGIIIPNGCVSLAKYYSKRGQKEKAILILEKEKRTLKFIMNKEYREPILRYLDELKKSQKGIRKHFFSGYDSWPGPFLGPIDNPIYHPELEKKYNDLKGRYKSTFEYHRDFLEKIDFYEARIKENADDIESKENYNTYCLSDINLLPKMYAGQGGRRQNRFGGLYARYNLHPGTEGERHGPGGPGAD